MRVKREGKEGRRGTFRGAKNGFLEQNSDSLKVLFISCAKKKKERKKERKLREKREEITE